MRAKGGVRVVIADGHPIFRIGVKALLAQHDGLKVVGEAGDTARAVEVVIEHRPDVLLTDHRLPALDGLEIVRQIKAARLATRAVILTAAMAEADIQSALMHGAWGVVLKHVASDVLPKCIEHVMLGEHWVGVESVNALVGTLRSRPSGGPASLTRREVEIVREVARGASNKDIASRLTMGEQTVKNHLRRIFRKLQVANRVELALRAVEQQLITSAAARLPEDDPRTA